METAPTQGKTNETQLVQSQNTVPAWVLRTARALTPSQFCDEIEGDLLVDRPSPTEYVRCCSRAITGFITTGIKSAFSFPLVFGEAAFLFLPLLIHNAHSSILPLETLLFVELCVLRLRDAYSPGEGSAGEIVTDAGFTAAVVLLFEFAFALFLPTLAISGIALLQALSGAVLAAQWRGIYHREDPPDKVRRDFIKRNIATWHMNALVMAATAPIAIRNVKAAPGGHLRDFLLGFLPPIFLALAWRLKKVSWAYLKEKRVLRVLDAGYIEDDILALERQLALLPVPDKDLKIRWHLFFEALFFLSLGFVPAISLWRWMSSDPLAIGVDWRQIGVNSGALLVILALWLQIKKVNYKLAEDLSRAIHLKKLTRTQCA